MESTQVPARTGAGFALAALLSLSGCVVDRGWDSNRNHGQRGEGSAQQRDGRDGRDSRDGGDGGDRRDRDTRCNGAGRDDEHCRGQDGERH
jgi:hypothetical protein